MALNAQFHIFGGNLSQGDKGHSTTLLYYTIFNRNVLPLYTFNWKIVTLQITYLQWNPPPLTATIITSPHYYGHFFWPPGKMTRHFLVKKNPCQYGHPINTAKCFWPIGDRINGVPPYFIRISCKKEVFLSLLFNIYYINLKWYSASSQNVLIKHPFKYLKDRFSHPFI